MPVPTMYCAVYAVPTRFQEGATHCPLRRGAQGLSPVGSEHFRCTEETLQGPPQQPCPLGTKTSFSGSTGSLICIGAPLYTEPCTAGGPATKGGPAPPCPPPAGQGTPPTSLGLSFLIDKVRKCFSPSLSFFPVLMRLKQ